MFIVIKSIHFFIPLHILFIYLETGVQFFIIYLFIFENKPFFFFFFPQGAVWDLGGYSFVVRVGVNIRKYSFWVMFCLYFFYSF